MASAVAVGEQQIRRRRHAAAAARSPLQALDTNRAGDSDSKEVYITPKSANADDASVRTPKRASTTKRPSSSSHGASFFSPPRALREPIPFLSPTAPNYKDFAGTEDGTLPPLGILKFYHLTFVIHPLFVSFALSLPLSHSPRSSSFAESAPNGQILPAGRCRVCSPPYPLATSLDANRHGLHRGRIGRSLGSSSCYLCWSV